MESIKRVLPSNPREKANFFSIIFFSWALPFFKKGYKKILQLEDIFRVLSNDRSEVLGDRLEKNWNDELSKPTEPSLIRAVVKTFQPEYFKLAIFCLFNDVILKVAQPFILGKLLLYFRDDKSTTYEEAILYASGLIGVNFIFLILFNQVLLMSMHSGMKIRVAICSLIYRKALRLSHTALNEISIGKIVNLLSNDVSRFDQLSLFLNTMWEGPILATIVCVLLWNEIRWAGLFGVAIIIIIVPIQSYSGKLSSKFRLQTAILTDERIRFMDEIIYGIQVIKMYAWEMPFAKIISHARKLELRVIRKNSYVRALYMTFMLFTTRIAMFCTMLSIALIYGSDQLTAAKVFSVSSYFSVLSFMSMLFVRGFAEIAEALVALKRLKNFFLLDERKLDSLEGGFDNFGLVSDEANEAETERSSVLMKQASARWHKSVNENNGESIVQNNFNVSDWPNMTLSNLNLSFPKGKLIGITGPVGCGKSSLLQALLRELSLETGVISINGSISYASQEPWIFAASARQNILFGEEFDYDRYTAIVEACALYKDFEQLGNGDRTIIGERGVSLSGGQKARVNLARTTYRDADIYLLDDPLSAVDAHVGAHLFKECIGPNSFLAQKKTTRILVTHQVHFLKEADLIIVLRDGKIEAQGSPAHLIESGFDFKNCIGADEKTDEQKIEECFDDRIIDTTPVKVIKLKQHNEKDGIQKNGKIEENFQMEDSSKGRIIGSVALSYFQSGNNRAVYITMIILFLLVQFLASAADFWVSIWTRQEEIRSNERNHTIMYHSNHQVSEPLSTNFCMSVHGIILVSLFVFAIVRSISFYITRTRASQVLHDSMFKSLISTSMQFFNTNPSGRILNRFSKDIGAVDEALPKALLDTCQLLLSITASIIVTAMVNPIFILPTIVIGIFFVVIRKVYLKTSKNVKRLEGITKSPIFTHLGSTMNGLATVRALKAEKILRSEFDCHQDTHTACWYMFIATHGAFGLSLDVLCFAFVTCVIYFCIFIDSGLSGDKVGLAITQSISLIGVLQWGVRQSAEVSNQMTAVERVLEYQQLEPENQLSEPQEVSKDWPTKGCIEFRKVFYRYSTKADHVLHGLSLMIKSKEKIGIVGRTGAGKSSLVGALFRLAQIEGKIIIDDIETSTISLKDLRSRITIIPQDPVLFSGTLRRNLDPFEEYSDDDIWRVLEEVELKQIASGSSGLSTNVLARGSNFSVGQRQLLCLARALLQKNRILVLDEATANVDPKTDSLIQQTIREKFADCTVLTVAHRLHTIIDSDRVLVMDNGRAVEFDTPHKLLENDSGSFTRMVKALGLNEFEKLFRMTSDKNGKIE